MSGCVRRGRIDVRRRLRSGRRRWSLRVDGSGDVRLGAQKVQSRAQLLAVQIVHHGLDAIANGVADDDVLDVVEKVGDGIDVAERLLVGVDARDEIVRHDHELETSSK